jgi:hypothetical protein
MDTTEVKDAGHKLVDALAAAAKSEEAALGAWVDDAAEKLKERLDAKLHAATPLWWSLAGLVGGFALGAVVVAALR